MGWDRAKAIDFFLNNSPVEPVNAESEIDRYISWPVRRVLIRWGSAR